MTESSHKVADTRKTENETGKESSSKARLASGVVFLRAADKRKTTISFRINFLKSKGFSAEEIFQCFEAAGQPQPMDAIQRVFDEHPKDPQRISPSAPSRPQYSSPYFAPVPPLQEGYSWKDGFIVATIGSLIGYGAYKAATAWLPWEVVLKRKEEKGAESKRKRNREKSREQITTAASEPSSEMPAVARDPPPVATTQESASTTAAESDELKAVKAELAEKSDQYAKVMREKAELTVKSAQVKAQQAQSARAIENANKKIADLERQLKEALEKLHPPVVSETQVDDTPDEKASTEENKLDTKPVAAVTVNDETPNSSAPAAPQSE